MRPIGGEIEVKDTKESIFFSDSGRSSLRLFIRNIDKKKVYLIPNYFCKAIESTLIDEGVSYKFYNVLEDLSIDKFSVNRSNYDILYIINYFGKIQNLVGINIGDKILLEDNVFLYDFTNTRGVKNWFSFNSFRKITELADGSLIKTTLDIDPLAIEPNCSKYSSIKYMAKNNKNNYINHGKGAESDYLDLFKLGENELNNQRDIYSISDKSCYYLSIHDVYKNQIDRKSNFESFYDVFWDICVNSQPEYYSFFTFKVENNNYVVEKLAKKGIYLPIHWIKSTQENALYGKLISIPCFGPYNHREINYVINSIRGVI